MGSLFRAYISGDDFDVEAWPSVAPAPAGDVYLALTDTTPNGHVARVSASGVPVWQFDTTGEYAFGVASNADHVAFLTGTGSGTGAVLLDEDGTTIWDTELPLTFGSTTATVTALSASEAFAIFSPNTASTETVLVLLNGTTGAITWAVNLRTSGGDAGFKPHGVAFLSGGDLVVSFLRAGGQTVQRISATDGSVVWSRGISNTGNYAIPGVDGSDNIYLVGDDSGSPKILPVMKLDSSGTTLWSRQVEQPAGLHSAGLSFDAVGGLTAGSTGVFIPVSYGGSSTTYCGFVFVPAAGTIATGNASIVTVDQQDGVIVAAPPVGGVVGGAPVVMGFRDESTWAILTGGETAIDDAGWGAYTRTTWAGDVASGSMSASSSSYTRETTGSFSASAYTLTQSTGTLAFDVYDTHSVASSVAPATAFGTPIADGGPSIVGAWTVTTAFGTPMSGVTLTATGLAAGTTFGTPTYDDLHETVATSIVNEQAFGLPFSIRGLPPAPHVAQGLASMVAFGTPARFGAATVFPESTETTAFGTPSSGPHASTTGISSTAAFGTPTMHFVTYADSLGAATSFGLPVAGGFGTATGFVRTLFGTPEASAHVRCIATGFGASVFGTPSTLNNYQRARSGVFRTQWGRAQAERTAP